MKAKFAAFSLFFSISASGAAHAQAPNPEWFAEQERREREIESGESALLQGVVDSGRLGEAELDRYTDLLSDHLTDRDAQKERIGVLVPLLEGGLRVRHREELVSADLRARIESGALSEDEAFAEIGHELESSALSSELSRQAREMGEEIEAQLEEKCPSPKMWNAGSGSRGRFYVAWGYNRAWYGKTDSTFHTPEGTFTIHDAEAHDRPSPFDPAVYFNPEKFSIPQYNITVGYQFHPRWAVELNHDHMKWVFDSKQRYDLSGDYSPVVYVDTPNAQGWDPGTPMTFADAKANRDATWIRFEHTNGYNYVSGSVLYRQPLLATAKKRLAIDASAGAGAGAFIPQTGVYIRRDAPGNWVNHEADFHLAGFGGHVNGGVRFTFYDRLFFQATARSSWIKVTRALVDNTGSYLSQTPIQALELIGQLGWNFGGKRERRVSRGAKR